MAEFFSLYNFSQTYNTPSQLLRPSLFPNVVLQQQFMVSTGLWTLVWFLCVLLNCLLKHTLATTFRSIHRGQLQSGCIGEAHGILGFPKASWRDLRVRLSLYFMGKLSDKFHRAVRRDCILLMLSAIFPLFMGFSSPVGCHFLLQRIFPTQGLNPGLLHCRQTLYHLSHQGDPWLK